MANVAPADIVIRTERDSGAPKITLLAPGTAPSLGGGLRGLAGAANLESPEIRATAIVTVRGAAGDDVGFWRFGFIQLKTITDEWAHYRGATPADGSVFVAMDRPPARPQQLCRDTAGIINPLSRLPYLEPVIFYYPETALTGSVAEFATAVLPLGTKIPGAGNLTFRLKYSDSPGRRFAIDITRVNQKAKTLNFLYSLYSGNAYATMLAVQKGPGKPIEVMRSFQWNVRWRAHFETKPGMPTLQIPPRPGDFAEMNISHVVMGPPNDLLFQRAILDSTLPNCIQMAQKAFAGPVVLESTKWEDWKVQH
jgi:hypothetical protein